MKKLLSPLFFTLAYVTSLTADIYEAAHFCELKKYVQPNSLVLLDIDDTLLLPVQTLGTDIWFIDRLKEHQFSGLSKSEALDKTLAQWEAIRHLTKVKIVEPGTEEIVAQLQAQKIPVFGLSTQGLALATRTLMQLLSLGIDLTKTCPCDKDVYFMNGQGVLYRNGLLFTSGTPKGKALRTFFELIGYKPQHIVFINDKKAHLLDVESEVEAMGIPFTGLRYSYGDERVANYDPEIADIQWRYSTFGNLLSDEIAIEMKGKGL